MSAAGRISASAKTFYEGIFCKAAVTEAQLGGNAEDIRQMDYAGRQRRMKRLFRALFAVAALA